MTSAEIRAALTQTLALSPAIAQAAEIVASAERAEVSVSDADKRKAAIQQDIDSMQQAAENQRAELNRVNEDLDAAKKKAVADKESISSEIDDLLAKKAATQKAFEEAQITSNGILADLEAQIAQKQKELDGLKQEMDALVSRLSH